MKNVTRIWQRCGAAMVVVAFGVVPVGAQSLEDWEDRGFANISIGSQPTGRTHLAKGEFDLYDEAGSYEASLGTGAAPIVDLMGGVRVWRNVAAAIGYSFYSDSVSPQVTARIPDPLFVDAFAQDSVNVGGLRHREQTVHLSAAYMLTIQGIEPVQLMFFAGPSIFALSKGVVSGVSVEPGTQNLAGATTQNVSGTGLGGHFGIDARYPLTERFGAGLLLRWASGSVDVPQVEGGDVSVGGLSVGVGLRYSF